MEIPGEGEEVLPVEPVVLQRDADAVLPDDGAAEGEHAILGQRQEDCQRLTDRGAEPKDAQPGEREVLGDRHADQPRSANLHREIGLDAWVLAFTEVVLEEFGHARSVSPAVGWGNFLATTDDAASSTPSRIETGCKTARLVYARVRRRRMLSLQSLEQAAESFVFNVTANGPGWTHRSGDCVERGLGRSVRHAS